MELSRLINHPEEMNKETLYNLRSLLALYPYYQTARLLLLQNLYILHEPSFDEELRRAAIYITDRNVIFQMTEAAHYRLRPVTSVTSAPATSSSSETPTDRTSALIDSFLDSIPADAAEEAPAETKKRKPTPADAAVDYVAYLLETETEEERQTSDGTPQMKGQQLIDSFLSDGGFNIHLDDAPAHASLKTTPADTYDEEVEDEEVDEENMDDEYMADGEYDDEEVDDLQTGGDTAEGVEQTSSSTEKEQNEGYFTETLARIYIKQGRYEKALEIIQRLNLNYPKKNAYFADQIRFLEKLILNNKNKK